MKTEERLSDAFGLIPSEPTQVPNSLTSSDIIDAETGEITNGAAAQSSMLDIDFENSRANIRELTTLGKDLLTDAIKVAKESEHPRAYEVVGTLVKQLADVNQQLLDLHTQKQKLDAPRPGDVPKVTNNAIFVGSTAELTRILKKLDKEE